MRDSELTKCAKKSLGALVSHVAKYKRGNKWMTYGDLAKAIGFPKPYTGNLFGLQIGQVLGKMGHMFDNLTVEGEPIPLIQTLVVNSGTKLPSDGLKEFSKIYPNLSKQKKHDFVSNEYERIFRFGSRWLDLLKKLRIQMPSSLSRAKQGHSARINPFGSEGSPEHRRLIDRIKKRPRLIGLQLEAYEAVVEYPLRSGDAIDLVLQTEDQLIAVEVKSRRSGPDDISRGIFQCVKYKAVLEAEAKLYRDPHIIRTILALEPTLDHASSRMARALGVAVVDAIK